MNDKVLAEYQRARHFDRSPEPEPSRDPGRGSGEEPYFVIQHHAASSNHYDLRLQAGGVLKSWAVPKGPSTDPRDRRLAIRTEDHPIAYRDFEGVIPEGEYGAGTVMLWDAGTYDNHSESENDAEGDKPSIEEQIEEGHVTIWLRGQKIRGGYALVRVSPGDENNDEEWLLVKMDDEEADARRNPVSTQSRSVKTDRSMDEIRHQEKPRDST